jgi:hypothetical protein
MIFLADKGNNQFVMYAFQDSMVKYKHRLYSGNLKLLSCMCSNGSQEILYALYADCCVDGVNLNTRPPFSLSSYVAPKLPPQVATQRKILEILSQSFSSLCRNYNIACTSCSGSEKKARAKNGTVGRKILRPFYRNKSTAAIEEKYKRH